MPLSSKATRTVLIAVVVALGAAALVLSLPSVAKVSGGNKTKTTQSKVANQPKVSGDNKPKTTQSQSAPADAKGGTEGAAGPAADAATPAGNAEPDFPKVLPTKEEEQAEAEAKPDVWSENEIAEAKAHCDKILHGVEAVLESAEPVKEGECGAPAPVRLISIGRSPEVVLSPPVTVTCDLVVKLADWIKDDLQDLAKTHLGAPIARLSTMSSYSCRNAYGRKKTRLSEHGRANAVDVGSFTTSSGSEVSLLTGWGMTVRDIQAIVAAAKAAAEKAAAERAAAEKAAAEKADADKAAADKRSADSGAADKAAGKNPGSGKATEKTTTVERPAVRGKSPAKTSDDITAKASVPEPPVRKAVVIAQAEKAATGRKLADRKNRGKPGRRGSDNLTVASHLGGPNADSESAAMLEMKPQDSRSQFLRAAHSSACRRFGTVLGPESNDAHRNHFHLDMAERKRSNYCE